MDDANDEPLIVQLWLDLEKRVGWYRVRDIYSFGTFTVSVDVNLSIKLKGQKRFFKILSSHRVSISSFSFFICYFPHLENVKG